MGFDIDLTPEETVFRRKRFIKSEMLRFGFIPTATGYRLKADFMNGDFTAILTVAEDGKAIGSVTDNMNGEEYAQLRNDRFCGPYVNAVRAAYEELLERVAAACCEEAPFACEQANRITDRILSRYGVEPDHPFEKSKIESYGVFRHRENAKWFALIMNVSHSVLDKNEDTHTVDIVNLKAEPETIGALTQRTGVYPAYHMNRKHWISVALDDSLSDDEVMDLISDSFRLTLK